MSVVVGIKQKGVWHLGADTQMSSGSFKDHYRKESNYKIKVYDNGLIAGFVGTCSVIRTLRERTDLFEVPEEGLTMKFIVSSFLPKVYELFKEREFVKDADKGRPDLDLSMALVYKDKCFLILGDLKVWEVSDSFSIGAGDEAAAISIKMTEGYKNVETRLLTAMRLASFYISSVGAPYVLIDNENYEYTVKEG